MATRLYFHAAATTVSGTLPSGENSGATADWTATGATTLRTMNTTIGTGQTSHSGSTKNTTALQSGLLGIFVSPPLVGSGTVGGTGKTVALSTAAMESNVNANFIPDFLNLYVWRPSTGAYIGLVVDNRLTGGLEPTAASSEQSVYSTQTNTTSVSYQDGDVLVAEVWYQVTQSMNSSYTATFYYDGTTVTANNNTVVSNHASFVEVFESLTFAQSLAPSLVTNTPTFFSASVTPGAMTLAPSLVTNTSSFHAPAVSQVQTLTPSLFTNTSTFHVPTVSAVKTLTPALVTDGESFFAPTVTPGAVTLTPSLATNASSFYSPTVGRGTITLSPALLTDGDAFYAPVVTQGGVTLAPALLSNAQVFYAPTVGRGPVTLAPSLLADADGFFAPTVTPGVVTLLPGLYVNIASFYTPTVDSGEDLATLPPLARMLSVGSMMNRM